VISQHTKNILEFDKIRNMLGLQALTPFGRELSEELSPVTDIQQVRRLQKETEDGVKLLSRQSVPPLESCPDIRSILKKTENQADLSCKELLDTALFLDCSDRLIRYVFGLNDLFREENDVVKTLCQIQSEQSLRENIVQSIMSEEELFDTASPLLFSIRKKIRNTQAEVKKSLESIVKNHSKELQEQLITLRGNRYVLMVKTEYKAAVPGIIHDTSSTKATLFVEPFPVVELNNQIRELLSSEREEINRILKELSAQVNGSAILLYNNIRAIQYADFSIAKAKLSLRMDARAPSIHNETTLKLIDARHPLIAPDKVVPITLEIGDLYQTLLITGPNTGGKTVSLKTCGLLTLMTLAGLQIPAKESSTIPVFQDIFADIGDEQSIEQNLSTFSSHIKNLIEIIDTANPSMLVLADELGSGTEPSSGAALAIAILDHLKSAGCITIATTHYKELKHYAIATPGVENASCEFEINTLMPTYRIRIGIPGTSNAFNIAKRLGMPEDIIEQARNHLEKDEIDFEQVIAETEKARKNAEQNEEMTKIARQAAQRALEETEKMRSRFEQEQQTLILKSKHLAKEYASETYDEVNELLEQAKKSLREKELEQARDDLDRIKKQIKNRNTMIEAEITDLAFHEIGKENAPQKLTIGETYFSASLRISGILVEIQPTKSSCTLLFGNRRINVPVSSLRNSSESKAKSGIHKQRKTSVKRMTTEKRETFTSEIKLIGLSADDAIEELDKFLDDAVITGAGTIRIVHGKGSGILRTAVSRYLKNDKRVTAYRLGELGEGDSGVTIVTL
jgi:DNA mismatch repair protein MutS2